MVTMFTTTWCAYCRRLKRFMQEAGIEFREVNIEEDEAAAHVVMNANHGDRTVPTLQFADGSTLTNPSITEVKDKLAALV